MPSQTLSQGCKLQLTLPTGSGVEIRQSRTCFFSGSFPNSSAEHLLSCFQQVGHKGCPQPHSDTLGPHLLGRMTSGPAATEAALGNLGEGAGGGAHVGTGDGACSETALRFWQGSRAFVLKLCLHAFDQTCLTFLVRDSSKTSLIQG